MFYGRSVYGTFLLHCNFNCPSKLFYSVSDFFLLFYRNVWHEYIRSAIQGLWKLTYTLHLPLLSSQAFLRVTPRARLFKRVWIVIGIFVLFDLINTRMHAFRHSKWSNLKAEINIKSLPLLNYSLLLNKSYINI